MLLSDKLIEIGRQSNPKNNCSMGEAEQKMTAECKRAIAQGELPSRTENAMKLAKSILAKEGYKHFNK